LAGRADCVVISVDYRLAPEHRVFDAVEDVTAAFRAVASRARALDIDPGRIAVAGDSAGATLATVVCQRQIIDGRSIPCLQVLVYPLADLEAEGGSRRHFAEGYFLTDRTRAWFEAHYLGDVEVSRRDPRLSPLYFEHLEQMPPSWVVTAGFDLLRDEGDAYAGALRDSGVSVVHRCEDRLVHGFILHGGEIDAARRAVADIAEELRRGLAQP
jgi:acetyl esterase